MIYFPPAGYAVLSQNLRQHGPDLPPADGPTLNQTDHHAQIHQHRCRPWTRAGVRIRNPGRWLLLGLRWRVRYGCPPRPLAITVLLAPVFPAVLSLIVRDTPFSGLALAVGFAATKRTPQIPAPSIARMREEENAAMSAAGQAGSQVGLGAQRPSQDPIIFLHQIGHPRAAIPIRTKREIRLDLNC